MGTDTKGRGKRRSKLGRIGSSLGKIIKGGGRGLGAVGKGVGKGAVGLARGAGAAAKSAAGAATTVGKGIVQGAKSAGSVIAKTGPAAASKAASVIGSGAKLAAGAAKFAGPVGLAITGALAVTDGLKAGMEEFKKSGKLGKAVQEGLAGAASGLTFGLVSQETISGGMSKIGKFFRPEKSEFEKRTGFKTMEEFEKNLLEKGDSIGGASIEKRALKRDARINIEVNRQLLKDMMTNPKKYIQNAGDLANLNKEIRMRRQQLKKDVQFYKEMGGDVDDISVPSPFTVPNRTGRAANKTIREGMRNQGEGSAVAPVVINNDASVRSNSSNTQVNNETITPRDGMLVSAISDF